MTMSVDLADTEFETEVRDAMSDLSVVPEDTIIQTKDRLVEPELNDKILDESEVTQQEFNTAAIYRTAERAFKTWLPKKSEAMGELEVELGDVDEFIERLEDNASESLSRIDITVDRGGSVEFVETTQGDLWF